MRTFHRTCWLALAAVCAVVGTARAQDRRLPNVILITADDLGWTDAGCYGSKYYETPNLDKMAAEGMRFTSAYTNGPNCVPTRAALITGQYGPRTGMYTVGTGARGLDSQRKLIPVDNVTELPAGKQTVADAMKAAGYTTAIFGKWHLGNAKGHHAADRGFDEAILSQGKHFDFVTSPKTKTKPGEYLADFLTDRAVDFIERNQKKPFFLYLSHFGVHTPLQAKKELVERFEKKAGAGGHDNAVYAAMLASVDESVGRVLAKLDELKLSDDTLVIFTSDNGGVGGYLLAGVMKALNITTNLPLRGGKGMLYEGGVRVIFITRWRGRVRPGSTSDTPVASIDIFPTLMEVSRGKAKKGHALDGASIVPVLDSGGKADLKRDLFWHFPGYLEAGKKKAGKKGGWRTTPAGSIRSGDWKLLEFFEDGRLELYNLKDDLGQKTDLAKKMPEVTRELHEKLKAWRKEVGAPMPQPNPNFGKAGASSVGQDSLNEFSVEMAPRWLHHAISDDRGTMAFQR